MPSGKKRSRTETEKQEEKDSRNVDLAECKFEIVYPSSARSKSKKRRKTGDGAAEDTDKKHHLQVSPFAPWGTFKTYNSMDLRYEVRPVHEWNTMTKYNSFVLNGTKYFTDGYIRVANDSTIERQRAIAEGRSLEPRKKAEDDWIARILEIRAQDEHHVFARVYWMYWPDELPEGTRDGNKIISGRQPYHGARELVASNHMDIINVVSVTDKAEVKQMNDDADDEVHEALYWRQALDVRTHELSSLQGVCKCGTPNHPDKVLVGCPAGKCRAWMHSECIIHEGLLDVYARLGTDKPYEPDEPASDDRPEKSIDAKPNGTEKTQETKDNVEAAGEDGTPTPAPTKEQNDTKTTPDTASKRKSRSRKSDSAANGTLEAPSQLAKITGKPYKGLFEAALLLDVSPPVLEITDLREDVKGGKKKWQERIKCLLCGTEVS